MSKWQWRPPWPRRVYLWFRYVWPIRTVCDLFSLAGYTLTGYCGYGGCGHITLYRYWEQCRRCIRNDVCRYSGEQVRPFVPEAGCPVHDYDSCLSRWARKARKGREQSPWRA